MHPPVSYRLVIDFGNTLTKVAVFRGKVIIREVSAPEISIRHLEDLTQQLDIVHAISASVREIPGEILSYLERHFHHLLLSDTTPVPIKNLYETPKTLGMDRLAMVVGAWKMFPQRNTLVIGAGTCITYDLVDREGQYHGGAISPGIHMRLNALHTFTSKLPLVSPVENPSLIGTSTETSIQSGVIHGVIAEVDGFIDGYHRMFDPLQVILTGGDQKFLAGRLKNRIFAIPNLVLSGLNEILEFNVG